MPVVSLRYHNYDGNQWCSGTFSETHNLGNCTVPQFLVNSRSCILKGFFLSPRHCLNASILPPRSLSASWSPRSYHQRDDLRAFCALFKLYNESVFLLKVWKLIRPMANPRLLRFCHAVYRHTHIWLIFSYRTCRVYIMCRRRHDWTTGPGFLRWYLRTGCTHPALYGHGSPFCPYASKERFPFDFWRFSILFFMPYII